MDIAPTLPIILRASGWSPTRQVPTDPYAAFLERLGFTLSSVAAATFASYGMLDITPSTVLDVLRRELGVAAVARDSSPFIVRFDPMVTRCMNGAPHPWDSIGYLQRRGHTVAPIGVCFNDHACPVWDVMMDSGGSVYIASEQYLHRGPQLEWCGATLEDALGRLIDARIAYPCLPL